MTKPVYAQTITTIAAQGSNGYVYLPMNNANGTVNVYDPVQAKVVSTVTVAPNPIVCVVTPDGKYCYAFCTNGGTAELDCIDTSTNLLVWRQPFAMNAIDMCITPDGAYVYVVAYINIVVGGNITKALQVVEIRTADRHIYIVEVMPTGGLSAVYTASASDGTLYIAIQTPASGKIYAWKTPIANNAVTLWSSPTGTTPLIVAASPDGGYVGLVHTATASFEIYNSAGILLGNLTSATTGVSAIWSADSQVVYWADATTLRWTYIGIPSVVAGSSLVGQSGDGMAISPDGKTLFYVDTSNGDLFPFDTFEHVFGTSVAVGSNPVKPGTMLEPLGAVQTLNIVQVGSGQTWNVTLSTTAPSTGSGTYALLSGTRIIARANIGQNIGPFTAYDSEVIALQVSGTAAGFTASVAGVAYERGEQVPIVFPGISG